MEPYKNGEATSLVEGKFFEYDFENQDFPGKSEMESAGAASTFSEYILLYARQCGYTKDASQTGSLASFVFEQCTAANAYISRQTLVNWLSKGLPANTAGGRENVYRLCFALQMNAQQTQEFFLKAYLERPFNYKDIHEAVYFFCLNHGCTYSDARRIISDIESMPIKENPYADNITAEIGKRLSRISSEEELLQYIADNRSGFAIQNKSATDRIKQLVISCQEIAPKEYGISCPNGEEITVDTIDALLNVIYGYAARGTINAKPAYKKSISKSRFPELIRRNWPQREQFAQILEKKTASYDVIRRALIMLDFYDFFAKAIVAEKETEEKRRKTGAAVYVPLVEYGLFDEFTDEMNATLADCGYVQLYWRNPFDWMIGHCAISPDPLGTLRNLIDEYYLSDPAVQNQGNE